MLDVKNIIIEFLSTVKNRKTTVYNESSLQCELGTFLREKLPNFLVQYERDISCFRITKKNSEKRRIDISIFSPDKKQFLCAIELKFPRNKQYPEQMFSFCKDISFMEHVRKNGFEQTFALMLAKDRLFYEGPNADRPPYNYFRAQAPLSGEVTKPTGRKDTKVSIKGKYIIKWERTYSDLKYTLKYTLVKINI